METIAGSIIIVKGRNDNYRQFRSTSNWFNNAEYFSLSENENCLTITKHYLDIPKNGQKAKTGLFMCLSKLPVGTFEFDKEESSEDVLVIYCQ